MNPREIRIGVIGAGYWGPNLIRNCAELGVLDCVCDVDEAALAKIRRLFPSVVTTASFDAVLDRDIHAVMIATPAASHASLSLQAVRSGKHVFVEKPLALTVEEGRQIEDAAVSADVSVFVGHLLLYHPAVRKLRSMIDEGIIGSVWHVRSRRLSLGKLRSHESVWWSFAPHDIALMLAIMGEAPQAVVASQTSFRGVDVCDVAYADFQFSGERSAHIEVCWFDPDKSARLDVFGSRGVLTLDDSRDETTLILKPAAVGKSDRGTPIAVRGHERAVAFAGEEPLKAEIQAFLESIRTGKPTESGVEHGIAVLQALSMADAATGRQAEAGVLYESA